ncbi:MAG: LexA family transcriptional regulator [Cyclobacteriaceae bacterium]
MYLSNNLKYLRKLKSMTQEELSHQLGLKRTMISAYEDGRSDPKLPTLALISEIFDVSMDELLFWDIPQRGRKFLQKEKMKILTVTLDGDGKEWISMVGQKASAGYLNGFGDPEFMENLPQFRLPDISGQTHRAFEISGDSMLPLCSGTIIIGMYVDNILNVKNGKTYILVTESEGIVYKRVFNYIEEKGKLFLVSDNDLFKPYEIPIQEVREIWEAKAIISNQFPDPREKEMPLTLEDIGRMITDLKNVITKTTE